MRPPRGQWIQAALGAPSKVGAQVGSGVLAGEALETGQVGSHGQPQLISEWRQVIDRSKRQFGEVHHAQTLSPLPSPAKPMKHVKRGMTGRVGTPRRWMFMQAGRPDHRTKRGPPTRGGVLSGRANTRRYARLWYRRAKPEKACRTSHSARRLRRRIGSQPHPRALWTRPPDAGRWTFWLLGVRVRVRSWVARPGHRRSGSPGGALRTGRGLGSVAERLDGPSASERDDA